MVGMTEGADLSLERQRRSEAEPFPELSLEVRRALPRRAPEALGALFDLYFPRVWAFVRRLVRDEHLAEDLTQDVFLQVQRALPRYEPERPLTPWIFAIATNKVRDHWRSAAHRLGLRSAALDDEQALELLAESEVPAAKIEGREEQVLVREAIETLPESMRLAIVLRVYEGLSFAEIGRLVERDEVAVRKRYSRALAELRRRLARVLPPGSGPG
jgi:RNA polymerase sigma-70 factor (ECF subfamily)